MPNTAEEATALLPTLALLQKAALALREADSFTACLAAANQNDKTAVMLAGKVKAIGAEYAPRKRISTTC